MSGSDRNEKVVESYKHFVVKAWLKYLVEQHDFQPPKWLTIQLMGSVKIAGPGDGALLVNDQSATRSKKPFALWRKVEEITRTIRVEWNTAINTELVRVKDRPELPSGTQTQDMFAVHERLWRTRKESRETMMFEDYELRREAGERLEIIPGSKEPGSNRATASSPPHSVAERAPPANDTITGSSSESEGQREIAGFSDRADTVITDGAAALQEGSLSAEATGDQCNVATVASQIHGTDKSWEPNDTVNVYKPMPDNWLHPLSLVIAMFTKLGDNPCPDLRLHLASGPVMSPKRRRKNSEAPNSEGAEGEGDCASSVSASTDNLLLSSTTIRHMVPPGETQSRAQSSAKKRAIDDNIAKAKFHDRLLDIMRKPPGDMASAEMTSCVKALTRATMEDQQTRKRERTVRDMEKAISLLLDLGEKEEAKRKQKELLALVTSPLSTIAMPVLPELPDLDRAVGHSGGNIDGRGMDRSRGLHSGESAQTDFTQSSTEHISSGLSHEEASSGQASCQPSPEDDRRSEFGGVLQSLTPVGSGVGSVDEVFDEQELVEMN